MAGKNMRLGWLFFVTHFFCRCVVSAQTPSEEFGEVSMGELKMARYESDTTAGAVIMFSRSDVLVDPQLGVLFEEHMRIKFFNQSEIKEWTNLKIKVNELGTVTKVKGIAYNLESDQVSKSVMGDEGVFKTKINKEWTEVRFAIPSVKAGTVVDLFYSVRYDALFLPTWSFQQTLPVHRSSYRIKSTGKSSYTEDIIGVLKPQKSESSNGMIQNWSIEKVPAFREEPFMPDGDEFIGQVDFYFNYNLTTWGRIVGEFIQSPDFGGQLRGSGYLKKYVEANLNGVTNSADKIDRLCNYVKKSIVWNGKTEVTPTRDFSKVLSEGTGTSAEINLLLVALLQKAGFDATPVAIRTRNRGPIKHHLASRSQLNDLIGLVKIDGKKFFLDATDRLMTSRFVPERCLNGIGLVISETASEWLVIEAPRSRLAVTTQVTISSEGVLEEQMKVVRDGILGAQAKRSIEQMGERDYVNSISQGKPWQLNTWTFKNIKDPTPLELECVLSISDHVQNGGERIYFNPLSYGIQDDNPLKEAVRVFPIDLKYPFENVLVSRVALPASYEIEDFPQTKVIALADNAGKFSYSVSVVNGLVTVTCQFVMNKVLFSPEDYLSLRDFFAQVVAKQSEQIVLKKRM